jgi:glyoxylase-like metal-dependent hydrolase (beta-lactamase superfamily II)
MTLKYTRSEQTQAHGLHRCRRRGDRACDRWRRARQLGFEHVPANFTPGIGTIITGEAATKATAAAVGAYPGAHRRGQNRAPVGTAAPPWAQADMARFSSGAAPGATGGSAESVPFRAACRIRALTTGARITDHVYWLPPDMPDRPSLCAVAGDRGTIWLDAGSSAAHARAFLLFLADHGVPGPSHVVLTHSHWDHVFGADELGAHVIAQERTASYLEELAAIDWSDEALDRRVASGEASAQHAAHVKIELPSPRDVRIARAEIVFRDGLDIDLGGVRAQVRDVGGDHADDSTVIYVVPDGVLFLGDCLYESPAGGYTSERLGPLIDALRGFEARLFVEGHGRDVLSPTALDEVIAEARSSLA